MKQKRDDDRSGVVRCQRCLKYGHYTYECSNDVAYRYRPSRTVLFKEKIQMQLKKSTPPKTKIVNPDYRRRVIEDRPSSQSGQQADLNKEKILRNQMQIGTKEREEKPKKQEQQSESESESESSSSSSDSSSESSSLQSSQSEAPQRKIRKKQ